MTIRLHVEAPLASDARVVTTQPQAHYLKNVMRRAAGDEILLFNGRDGEWRARIETLDRKGCALAVVAQTRAQPDETGPVLLIAPIKRGPMEWLVEKATELGVTDIRLVTTERTNAERVKVERLAAIAVEAAEQCGRLSVPDVHAPTALSALLRDWPATEPLYLLDETGGVTSIADAMQDHPRKQPPGFLIGPEGGFAQAELDAMKKLNFVTALGLGPRLLRAETAAVAALSCFQALAGDWAEQPGRSPARPAAAPQR